MKNTPEQFKGDEIPKQPTIYGADIQRSLQREASLEKPYLYGGQAMVQAIAECNLSAEMAQKLAKEPYERDALHLIRMLRRSEAERDFSLAYLRHRDDFFAKDKKRAKKVTNVICSEGPDTTMF